MRLRIVDSMGDGTWRGFVDLANCTLELQKPIARRTSSLRAEPGLIPSEGSQFFDPVVERLRSASEDRMAMLARQPSGSRVAVLFY